MFKAVLLDFDGTLVKEDLLAAVTEIVGKKEKSLAIDRQFRTGEKPGFSGLIERINLLKGVTVKQLEEKLAQTPEQEYLMPGVYDLLNFLKEHHIISILASGNIIQILQYFQKNFQIDYVIGSRPKIENNTIISISESDYTHKDFKMYETRLILKSLNINPEETIAIGDSPGDKSRFEFAGIAIAVNPKEGIKEYADYVASDLHQAKEIIAKLM